MLECSGASELNGRVTLTFRTGVAAGMDVARATLLAHSRQTGPVPKRVKLNGKTATVTVLEQGWISVAVRTRDAMKPLVVEGAVFDLPATPGFAPYLALEGPRASKAK